MAKAKQKPEAEKPKGVSSIYTEDDYKNWIEQAEAAYNKCKNEFETDRKYFENVQAPSDVPTDKAFVTDNRSTGLVRRLSGQMISGKINLNLTGGGERGLPMKMLHDDILEENDFQTLKTEEAANNFYTEGYGGIKFRYNPLRLSKYGIGKPEIDILQYDELWLDNNAKSGMHTDDIYRIHPKRVLLKWAKQRWNDQENAITDSMTDYSDTESERFCDLYEIEFRETKLVEEEIKEGENKGKRIKLEKDVYYIVKVINKTVVVEGPEPTGYPCFRLIPLIHTPRKDVENAYGRYPFGPLRLTSQTQDYLNVLTSMIYEAVRADLKNLAILKGATADEESQYKLEAAKTDGVVSLQNPNASVEWAPRPGIAKNLLEAREIAEHKFDATVDQYAPSRGEATGDMSGKAINLLQIHGVAGEFTAANHLEYSFTQLSRCILHCVTNEMNTPFYIISEVEDDEKTIHYNSTGVEVEDGDEYNIASEQGVINDMQSYDMPHMKIRTEVQMNVQQEQQVEIQKATMAHDRQTMAPIDFLKALFPKRYYEIWKNMKKHNQALQLMAQIAERGPEFMQQVKEIMDLPIDQINQMYGNLPEDQPNVPGQA
jgi:hypothetical protein